MHQGEQAGLQAFVLAERIRDAGLDVVLHCAASNGGGSFKTQMKKADASGAAFAVILGDDEIANHVATVKAMREADAGAQQNTVPFDDVVDYVVDQIIGDHDCGHDHGPGGHVHHHH